MLCLRGIAGLSDADSLLEGARVFEMAEMHSEMAEVGYTLHYRYRRGSKLIIASKYWFVIH